jgi:hypothetical protein
MKRKRTITIVVEREREVVIRHDESREDWCPSCGAQVQLLTVAEAARFTAVSELALYEQLELGALHFHETAGRRAVICLNSLSQQAKRLKATAMVPAGGSTQTNQRKA